MKLVLCPKCESDNITQSLIKPCLRCLGCKHTFLPKDGQLKELVNYFISKREKMYRRLSNGI